MARILPGRYTLAIILFVIIVFIVLTIAAIRYFGHASPTLQRFPPWISECPPYWVNEGNSKCSYNPNQPNGLAACKSELQGTSNRVQKLAYAESSPVDFSSVPLKDRCVWAKKCQVYWGGISDQNCNDSNHFNKFSLPG